MEGAPKIPIPEATNKNEALKSDWSELKVEAPTRLENRLEEIKGFEQMKSVEKVLALKELQETLAAEGNQNRYVDELLAERIMVEMEATDDATRSEYKLPLRTPQERQKQSTEPLPEKSPDWYNKILGYPPEKGDGVGVDQQQELSPGQLRAAA